MKYEDYDEYDQHQYIQAGNDVEKFLTKIKALWNAIVKAVRS